MSQVEPIQVYTWVSDLHLPRLHLLHLGLPEQYTSPVPFISPALQRGIAHQLLSSLIASTHASYVPWDRGISCCLQAKPCAWDQPVVAICPRAQQLHLGLPTWLVVNTWPTWIT